MANYLCRYIEGSDKGAVYEELISKWGLEAQKGCTG